MTTETKALGLIGLITLILVAGAVFFLSKPEKPVVVDPARLVKEDSNKMSTDSAKLTIVEFGDYQCPACGATYAPLKKAISEYPGQINFVFRHYPLPQHKNARLAAAIVEAAKLQGKLWEMHDALYENQAEWGETDNALDFFKKYASGLGLDVEKLVADANSSAVKDKVERDVADGNEVGINSTPTLYFNNELYKGPTSYEGFKTAIDSRLK